MKKLTLILLFLSSIAYSQQGKFPVGIISYSHKVTKDTTYIVVKYDSITSALFTRMPGIDSNTKSLVSLFVSNSLFDGYWGIQPNGTGIGAFYCLSSLGSSYDSTHRKLNWIQNKFNLDNISGLWSDSGWTGVPASKSYLRTNINPYYDSVLVGWHKYRNTFGVYIRNSIVYNYGSMICDSGLYHTEITVSGGINYIANNSGEVSFGLNKNVPIRIYQGLNISQRINNDSMSLYVDTTWINSSTTASTQIYNSSIAIGGVFSIGYNVGSTITVAFFGNLTEVQRKKLSKNVNLLMDAVRLKVGSR